MYATVQKCGWVTGSQELQKTGCYSLIGSHICDGEFSRLFPLLIKYIGLNQHKAHKGPKTSLQNCHLFHIIPLGPMDLVFLLLFWLPLEKKGKKDSIHNKIHIRKSCPPFPNVNTSLDYSLQDRCLLPAFQATEIYLQQRCPAETEERIASLPLNEAHTHQRTGFRITD